MTDALEQLERREAAVAILGIPQPILLAFIEAIAIEKAHAEAAAELGTKWPEGQCVEASIDLRDTLEEKSPRLKPVFVWGRFSYNPEFGWDHAWVELAGRAIVDVTAGQFLPPSLRDGKSDSAILVMPDDRLRDAYHDHERDPSWARWET